MAIAALRKMELRAIDIKCAYLQSSFDDAPGLTFEEVYLDQFPGYELLNVDGTKKQAPDGKRLVLLLQRPLYGLKTSGRYWFEALDASLNKMGFTSAGGDDCLFVRGNHNEETYCALAVYVDDIMLLTPSTSIADSFLIELGTF